MPSASVHKVKRKNKISYAVRMRFDERDPETGRRKEAQRTFATKKRAMEERANWLAEVLGGTEVEVTKLLFADVVRQWLDTVRPPQTKPTTYSGYAFLAEKHIIPALGGHPIRQIKAAKIEAFYRQKRANGRLDGKGGLSPKTISEFHNIIHAALQFALKNRWVPYNEATLASTPRLDTKRQGAWDVEDSRRFIAAAVQDSYHPYWLFVLTTGMRRGEALGVRWQDVDREAGIVYVRQQVLAVKGRRSVEPGAKTPAGERRVRLSAACLAALEAHRAVQDRRRADMGDLWADHDLVFTTGVGEPIPPSNIDRAWRALIKRANVPYIRPHDLRRTHSTLLRRQGVDPKVVSERLGHTSVEFTMDVYTNVLPEMEAAAARAIDAALFPDGAPANPTERRWKTRRAAS
jgi:integrase